MKLSTQLMYAGNPREAADQVAALEKSGLDTVWVAEAYGFDSPTLMGYLAAKTETVEIGSAILNVYSRTPGALAQTAAGLDNVSGGRAILGLGASGPQVIEGWHGLPYDKPLGRTREVVDIVRMALRRERLVHDGKIFHLPLPAGQGTGLGKPLKMLTKPERPASRSTSRRSARRTSRAPRSTPTAGCRSCTRRRRRTPCGATRSPRAPPSGPTTSARWRSWPAAWSASATTSRACSTWPGRCSRSTSAAWAPRARTSTTRWPASTASRPRPPRSRSSTSAATSATPRRSCRWSCSRWCNLVGPASYVQERIAAFRESGVTNLQVMPVPADGGDPAALVAQVKEWVA